MKAIELVGDIDGRARVGPLSDLAVSQPRPCGHSPAWGPDGLSGAARARRSDGGGAVGWSRVRGLLLP